MSTKVIKIRLGRVERAAARNLIDRGLSDIAALVSAYTPRPWEKPSRGYRQAIREEKELQKVAEKMLEALGRPAGATHD